MANDAVTNGLQNDFIDYRNNNTSVQKAYDAYTKAIGNRINGMAPMAKQELIEENRAAREKMLNFYQWDDPVNNFRDPMTVQGMEDAPYATSIPFGYADADGLYSTGTGNIEGITVSSPSNKTAAAIYMAGNAQTDTKIHEPVHLAGANYPGRFPRTGEQIPIAVGAMYGGERNDVQAISDADYYLEQRESLYGVDGTGSDRNKRIYAKYVAERNKYMSNIPPNKR